jgi:hypothetical protein
MEKNYGPTHPDVAIDLNNMAALLQATPVPIPLDLYRV